MTTAEAPARRLYHSPIGLYDFQALGVARCYYQANSLAVWSTGIGKTHLAMALAALLYEDDLIDQVVVIAEVNKVLDWCEDFRTFTDLTVQFYKGTPARRAKLRASMAQVLVATYETARQDAAKPGRTKRADWVPHALTLDLQGKRVLFVYDECTRLKRRSSGTYLAHECMVNKVRAASPDVKVLGLTATPIESSVENAFNAGRILAPENIGSVAAFERDQVVEKDFFGNPSKFKNIGYGSTDIREPGVLTLREKLSPALFVKNKSDADVKDQFPKQIEEFESVALGERHLDFYKTVRQACFDEGLTPMEERMLFGVMRQIAGYPVALASSQGKLAQAIVEQVGYGGLEALGSAKADYLLKYLNSVVKEQHNKAIVFTFYGQTILPILHQRLRLSDYNVVINHGQMSADERQVSKHAFRYGDAEVFLSSDAGSRGLNLPEATYVVNYELPLTYANYRQRADRVHRIDSLAEIVVTQSLIAADTVEEAVANMVLRRNEWHDELIADDDEEGAHMTASQRRELIEFARSRTKAA